jgi:phosphatidylglycerol:prolipoprotein diacylglycerol transferase
MTEACGFTLTIDNIVAVVGGWPLSWYGATYSLGFLGIWAWLATFGSRQGWSRAEALAYAILAAALILAGGRLFEVLVYEWAFYRQRPWAIPAVWLGGMATHGLLLGGVAAAFLHARRTGRPFLAVTDTVAIPAALFLAIGRVGNFLEGGVVGYETDVPWSVRLPSITGCRHPVALYDGLKNLLLVPILALVLARRPAGSGIATGSFLLLYGGLRFLVDQFRDYESVLIGLGPGRWFNLLTALLRLLLLIARRGALGVPARAVAAPPPGPPRIALFAALVLLPLLIPTSWTQVHLQELRERRGVAPAAGTAP